VATTFEVAAALGLALRDGPARHAFRSRDRGDRVVRSPRHSRLCLHGGLNGADSVVNVEYNFDDQPGIPALVPGEIYQWKLWADLGHSRISEDLLGIFQVPAEP